VAVAMVLTVRSCCGYVSFSFTYVNHIWSTHWSWRVHVSQACVTWPWPHYHGLLTLLNLYQVFVIRLLSPLLYNIGLSYWVHTLMMEGTYLIW